MQVNRARIGIGAARKADQGGVGGAVRVRLPGNGIPVDGLAHWPPAVASCNSWSGKQEPSDNRFARCALRPRSSIKKAAGCMRMDTAQGLQQAWKTMTPRFRVIRSIRIRPCRLIPFLSTEGWWYSRWLEGPTGCDDYAPSAPEVHRSAHDSVHRLQNTPIFEFLSEL